MTCDPVGRCLSLSAPRTFSHFFYFQQLCTPWKLFVTLRFALLTTYSSFYFPALMVEPLLFAGAFLNAPFSPIFQPTFFICASLPILIPRFFFSFVRITVVSTSDSKEPDVIQTIGCHSHDSRFSRAPYSKRKNNNNKRGKKKKKKRKRGLYFGCCHYPADCFLLSSLLIFHAFPSSLLSVSLQVSFTWRRPSHHGRGHKCETEKKRPTNLFLNADAACPIQHYYTLCRPYI